jgi:hypothetical protein
MNETTSEVIRQLADRFATYGDDQIASKRWCSKLEGQRRDLRAGIYYSVADELLSVADELAKAEPRP